MFCTASKHRALLGRLPFGFDYYKHPPPPGAKPPYTARAALIGPVETAHGMPFMCRNIKTLFNFDPPATDDEVRGASLQFVRKLSGYNKPSKINEAAFNRAVEEIATVARNLLDSLETTAPPRGREVEAEKARARGDRARNRVNE